ncbi:MAG: ABC transporter substrate-binding protein [Gemmatimonadetes bacterium]|nr:ABC transporter substrate-binding protein [Gemmatimonadota bacterium]
MSKKVFGNRLALGTALLALAGCAPDAPILIGLAGPISETRGASMLQAAELAVREVNDRGGIAGRSVQLLALDDSANAAIAVRVARRFYNNRAVVAVVGHVTSSTTLAAASVYGAGDTPMVQISPSASSPFISGAGPYTFRICPSDLVHGTRLAEWAHGQLGAERAAILYQNDDYGRGVRSTFVSSFLELGGVIVSEDPYIDDVPSFAPFLERVQQQGGADILLIAGTRQSGEKIKATLDTVGWNVQLMGGGGMVGIEESMTVEGMFISSAYLPDQGGDLNSEFVRSYRSAFPNQLPDYRGAGAYDIIHLLARAMEEVGADRFLLQDYLSRVVSFEGVTGTITFDQNGDVESKEVVIGVVTGGRLITAPGQ